MKDVFERELKIGDYVIVSHNSYGSKGTICFGIISSFTPLHAKIKCYRKRALGFDFTKPDDYTNLYKQEQIFKLDKLPENGN